MAKNESYHVERTSDTGRRTRVSDRGMTGQEADARAAELRANRPVGSSTDYRSRSDSRRG